MATLAERLDAILREKGLSSRKTARLLTEQGVTVTHAYIAQLRKGTASNPSLDLLTALARLVDVSRDWLAGDDEPQVMVSLTPEEEAHLARLVPKAQALRMRNVARRVTALKDEASLAAVEQMLDTMLAAEERYRQHDNDSK
ncbi:hypothetical protein [Nonomuraea bangladeshensis]|uniref:hypothetical protein n=1 Tax=Nonomuraea bangladeshensis TaxID=404385 RepID=UPI003C2F1829